MTRSKKSAPKLAQKKKQIAQAQAQSAVPASIKPPTGEELLYQAAAHISSLEYDQARAAAARAVELAVDSEDAKLATDALEILGTVELELDEPELARQHFLLAVEHSKGLDNLSPAPHLYLAQLSQTPEESLSHFSNALALLQSRLDAIEKEKLGTDGSAGSEADVETESDLRRSASRALVGMTELYLTDLCFEPEAEQNCEKFLAQAASVDPSDPEVHQTLASVRLSQERPQEAKDAAQRAWSVWRTMQPDSPTYPAPPSRLSLAKLFIELSEHTSALEILQRLENEDDEDSEMWYLSGWAWWLLGETRAGEPPTAEAETRDECWSESKLCLENYLRLVEAETEVAPDPEQLEHVRELLGKLEAAGIAASTGHNEGDEQWEDESMDGEDVDME